jgi:hypothetical protein
VRLRLTAHFNDVRARGHSDEVSVALGSLHRSDDASSRGARPMTKFYALIAACAVFAPMAFATLNQAAQIVA